MRVRMGLLYALFPVFCVGSGGQIVGQPSTPNPTPATIKICESPEPNSYQVQNCGTLTWNGQQYDAHFDGVEDANKKS